MRSERTIIFLVGAVQFVNILDFMMVMPLGPDFSVALGIPVSSIGAVGGAYTASAAVSGLLGAGVLDRFDRRKALAFAMGGLVIGTAMGGFATGLWSLLAARVLAGFFGGPATALAMSIVTDIIPAERRGKAVGAVMSAFSAASVLGVPAGLELARLADWRAPFFAVAGLGLLIAASAIWLLPPMRGHLDSAAAHPPLSELLARPVVRWSYLLTAAVMGSGFILIPNFSAYLQGNLGYPRDRLSILYLFGGAFSFVGLRLFGSLVDRLGSFKVGAAATVWLVGLIAFWFLAYNPVVPVLVLFVAFMLGTAGRNVAYGTLSSKVPLRHERARFQSLQSAVQHIASALGAFVSAEILVSNPDGSLGNVAAIAWLSIGVSLLVPICLYAVTRRLPPAVAAAA
ncbi:MAG: MFS transporter [Pseudomonadota bacterium]|nr:MFS transporter [Pseudomonadota bacterium]